jgi:hypothetical protein
MFEETYQTPLPSASTLLTTLHLYLFLSRETNPCAHLLAPHEKRSERKLGKEGERETKEEKIVVEAFKKKERGVPRPMSSSDFNRKRIGCKSNCSSSRRTGCKSSL